jgi:Mat/Ecp fimbriae major subunit
MKTCCLKPHLRSVFNQPAAAAPQKIPRKISDLADSNKPTSPVTSNSGGSPNVGRGVQPFMSDGRGAFASFFTGNFQMKAQRFNIVRIAGALALAGLVSGQAMAAGANEATATASAKIVQPITVNRIVGELNFGNVIPGATAGTVVWSPYELSATGGVKLPGTAKNAERPLFQVGGEVGLTYTLTFPSSITIESGSGEQMTVDNFNPYFFATDAATPHPIHNDPYENYFVVLATLNVGANQAVGTYTGSFAVSANYD